MWTLETLVLAFIAIFLLGYVGYTACYLAHVSPYRRAQTATLQPAQRPRRKTKLWTIVSGIVLAVSILAAALNLNWQWTLVWLALAVLALHYLVTNFLRFKDEQAGRSSYPT